MNKQTEGEALKKLLNEALRVAFRLGREDDTEAFEEHLAECLALSAVALPAPTDKTPQEKP